MLELLIALKWPLIIVQGLTSLFLIICILLQAGKGDDMASALSGQMGGGVQGSGGASKVLVRITVICAVIFMVNSIVLAKVFKEISSSSVTTTLSEPLAPEAPTTSGAPATSGIPAASAAPGSSAIPTTSPAVTPSPAAAPSAAPVKKAH